MKRTYQPGEVFHFTDQHLRLLRAAYVGWDDCEFGAPAIDCKRPYGNSSVYSDIAEILGIAGDVTNEDGDPDWSDQVRVSMRAIHGEVATALQIVLATGEFKIGRYKLLEWGGREWEYLGEVAP